MFLIGDKVVYPMHGAGVIEGIQRVLVSGKRRNYYTMRTMDGNMTVMIPVDNCDKVGLRNIISKDEAKKVLERFHELSITDSSNWNKRQRENIEKLKSGNIYDALGVLKNLMFRDKSKGLSTNERKTLASVRNIVISELMLTGFADREEIEAIMNDCIEELL